MSNNNDGNQDNTKRNIYKATKQTMVTEPKSTVNDTKNKHMRISKKIWQFVNNSIQTEPLNKLNFDDVVVRNYIIKKGNLDKLKNWDSMQKPETSSSHVQRSNLPEDTQNGNKKKSTLKLKVRRQLWDWSKSAIKGNPHWSSLLAENNIDIENVNIEEVDLGLIDVDELGIENKLLKRTITWLLK